MLQISCIALFTDMRIHIYLYCLIVTLLENLDLNLIIVLFVIFVNVSLLQFIKIVQGAK